MPAAAVPRAGRLNSLDFLGYHNVNRAIFGGAKRSRVVDDTR
jgi:hypothetical protein